VDAFVTNAGLNFTIEYLHNGEESAVGRKKKPATAPPLLPFAEACFQPITNLSRTKLSLRFFLGIVLI
jgi:hypothetical protein